MVQDVDGAETKNMVLIFQGPQTQWNQHSSENDTA